MILLHKDTHDLAPAPPFLTQYLSAERDGNLIEKLTNPSFAERTRCGSRWVKEIFSESIQRLGKEIANAPRESAHPKIIDEEFNEYAY